MVGCSIGGLEDTEIWVYRLNAEGKREPACAGTVKGGWEETSETHFQEETRLLTNKNGSKSLIYQ